MKIKTRVYSNGQAHVGAGIALKARLYVSGWHLSYQLKDTRSDPQVKDKVAITFVDDVPVSVASLHKGTVMAFTRKSERRKGYGFKTFSAMRLDKMPYHDEGVEGSWRFWKKAKETIG